ncbi:MAG: hypothetical protein V6Z81_03880, partial [Parvularculales bacterium]
MMNRVRLQPNERVSINGEPYQIISVSELNKVRVAHITHGAERDVSPGELDPYTDATCSRHREWDQLTPKQKEKALKKYDAIKPLLKLKGKKGISIAVAKRASELGRDERTLRRWISEYENRPQSSTLAGKTSPGGVRKKQIDSKIETIIQSVIEKYHETPERPTMRQTHEEICRRCYQSRLKPPSYGTVQNRINSRNRYESLMR